METESSYQYFPSAGVLNNLVTLLKGLDLTASRKTIKT